MRTAASIATLEFVVTCAVLAPNGADAAPTRVAAVVTIAGDATTERATIEADLSSTLAFVPTVELELARGDARRRILQCGVDSRCLGEAVQAAGAGLGLWIAIYETEGNALVTARLFDSAGGLKEPRVADVAAAALPERLRALVFDMLGRERHPAMGRVRVSLLPADASLTVDWAPTTERDLLLTPGPHVLRGASPRHEAKAVEVDVTRGAAVDAALHLEPSPPSWYERPWVWITAGAIVLAAGTIATVAYVEAGADPLVVCHGARDAGCP